jgi:hypothetical protein
MEHLHSTLRYLILVFLVASVGISLMKWMGKKPFTKGDKMTYLMTLIFCHIQLVVGFILYITNKHYKFFGIMKEIKAGDPEIYSRARFFAMEHLAMMLVAIILVTIGYSTAKRAKTDLAKHKKTFIFYMLGLVIIFIAIPWPFLKSWSHLWI